MFNLNVITLSAYSLILIATITQISAQSKPLADTIKFPSEEEIDVASNSARQNLVTSASASAPVLAAYPKQPSLVVPIIPYPTFLSAPVNYDFVTEFAWNLFKGSKLVNPIGNLALSPLMVEIILSQLQLAAAGRTHEEITNAIKGANSQVLTKLLHDLQHGRPGTQITMASAIFASQDMSLNPSFVTQVRSQSVGIVPTNFQNSIEAADTINSWTANATNNLIQKIFAPENVAGMRLLLTNTLYFRGLWKYAFNDTENGLFETVPGTTKSVTFMKQIQKLRGGELVLRNGPTGFWVELPYEGNEFSMILIVPNVRHSLDDFIRNMQPDELSVIMTTLLEPYKRTVHLKMPKFSIESTFSLVNVLLRLGIVNLFTINSELPNLTSNQEVIGVNDVLQKTVLQVDEQGTVAASSTSISVVTLSLSYPPEKLVINLDQPFLSIIVDKRNRIPLIVSKIFDP